MPAFLPEKCYLLLDCSSASASACVSVNPLSVRRLTNLCVSNAIASLMAAVPGTVEAYDFTTGASSRFRLEWSNAT